jgi:signal peptidase II
MKSRWLSVAIIAFVVLIDRVTKLYIRSAFSQWDVVPVIGRFFNIVHTENPGAAFGLLADSSSQWRGIFLVAISLVVMALIAGMLWRPHHAGMHDTLLLRIGLSLVFGGALGNVWDRLFRGTVTDFLQVFLGSYEFPSFNAADSAITIGAVILLIDLWRTRHRHPPGHPPDKG